MTASQVTAPVFRLVEHLELDHHITVEDGTTVLDADRRHLGEHCSTTQAGNPDHDHADQAWWARVITGPVR